MIHFFFIFFVILIIVRLKINNQRSKKIGEIKNFFQKYLPKRVFYFIFIKEQDHQRALKRWINLKKNITFLTKQKAEQIKFNCDLIISKQASKIQKSPSDMKQIFNKQQIDDFTSLNQLQLIQFSNPRASFSNNNRSKFFNFNIEKKESEQQSYQQYDQDLQSQLSSQDIQNSWQYNEYPKDQQQKNQIINIDGMKQNNCIKK
ncbi:hypothetical protein TTHERM_01401770 (macronuclear) [Tetrahymena thermophila SB210]|uniref:Transmembrane protein n=1 Tax=Tetrahymena thermophila (strain SB210) TaxID=312017 RepID=Q229H1_TETTS|nr:hypothetical protein TTHERM_01401770 [Tetrahymena thermophila SB210]EAR81940.2 hypothetical protein TTHERM_01401770 [Tetrahymena thermophila SB210]|eukprot:XP_001029603.2 hypothetical protein TTHERM_01401770 [Tetrahymena thermophila SB210]